MVNTKYISVTAGKDAKEVNAVLSEFQKAGYSLCQEYIPVIGILISEKTLKGIKPRNFRFAAFAEIPSLLSMVDGKAIPIIHYNTKNLDTLFEQVSIVFESTYNHCKLVQLNTTFPDVSQLERIRERFGELRISLQVDYRRMDLDQIADKVVSYGNCLDYVLIDPSRGRGDMFDIEYSTSLYLRIKDKKPDYGIVFAGGFSGDNIEEVLSKIIGRIQTKDFSICAEGRLRDKVSDEHWGMDVLNIEKVRKYLQAARKILN